MVKLRERELATKSDLPRRGAGGASPQNVAIKLAYLGADSRNGYYMYLLCI